MQKHYLHYLTDVMLHQWNDAALTDYNEDHEYSFGQLATEMLRLHELFKLYGIQKGRNADTIAGGASLAPRR